LRQSFSTSWISRPAVATALLLLTCPGGAVPAGNPAARSWYAAVLGLQPHPGREQAGRLAGRGPSVSLEDPLAKRAWFPNTSPVRVRPERDGFLPIRKVAVTLSFIQLSQAKLMVRAQSICLSHCVFDRSSACSQ
jgi:hypothetical protein